MRKLPALLVLVLLLASAALSQEAKMSVSKEETVRTFLTKQVGNKVTLRMSAGDEIGGTVKAVGDKVVHIEQVTGKEFFDAIVDLEKIDAVLIRR